MNGKRRVLARPSADVLRQAVPVQDDVLEPFREELRAGLEGGTTCPLCFQHAELYARKIDRGSTLALIDAYREHGLDWFHAPSHPRVAELGGAWARLRYWGLIEEQLGRREDGGRQGWWRITRAGELFLLGLLRLPAIAPVYNREAHDLMGSPVGISDALGEPFDLREQRWFSGT